MTMRRGEMTPARSTTSSSSSSSSSSNEPGELEGFRKKSFFCLFFSFWKVSDHHTLGARARGRRRRSSCSRGHSPSSRRDVPLTYPSWLPSYRDARQSDDGVCELLVCGAAINRHALLLLLTFADSKRLFYYSTRLRPTSIVPYLIKYHSYTRQLVMWRRLINGQLVIMSYEL